MDDEISPARLWGYACAVIGIVLMVSIGYWWFDVHTSAIRGRANVIKQNNDSNNQIQAQDAFNQLWGDIQTYSADVNNAAAQVTADTANGQDPTFDESALNASKTTCLSAVQKYNADTKDVTMKDWRPADDPATADPSLCEVQR